MKTCLLFLLALVVANYALRLLPLNHPVRQTVDTVKYNVRVRVARLFGYRPNLYRPNTMTSIWFLGFLFNRNPWPVEMYVDHTGVYVTRRRWYGLKVNRYFYPMNMVRLVTITEVMGFFAKIRIAVRMDYQLVHIQIDRYFPINEAEQFFREWQAHAQFN